MNPQLIAAVVVLALGLLGGWYPTHLYYGAKEDERAKVEAEAALEQEKRNVEIVTKYQDLLNGVDGWYRANPVRVRIQGRQDCPGNPAPRAEDIVLTVGGVAGSDRAATDFGLLGNHGAGQGAD